MRLLKKFLYLLKLAVVILTIGFFVNNFTQYKNGYKLSDFENTIYRTKDKKNYIAFGYNGENITIFYKDERIQIDEIEKSDGVFVLLDNESVDGETITTKYKIGVISKDKIYLKNSNCYFYSERMFVVNNDD